MTQRKLFGVPGLFRLNSNQSSLSEPTHRHQKRVSQLQAASAPCSY